MEKVFEISFSADEHKGEFIKINSDNIKEAMKDIEDNRDLADIYCNSVFLYILDFFIIFYKILSIINKNGVNMDNNNEQQESSVFLIKIIRNTGIN